MEDENGPAPLTAKEQKAIDALKAVAKIWPKSLWLFSASGCLCVMKKDRNGNIATIVSSGSEGPDQDYIVDTIKIENDGGDW